MRNGAREFVGSSGGNAGMAMAVAAKKIGKPLTLFIPKSTLPLMIEKLKVWFTKYVSNYVDVILFV